MSGLPDYTHPGAQLSAYIRPRNTLSGCSRTGLSVSSSRSLVPLILNPLITFLPQELSRPTSFDSHVPCARVSGPFRPGFADLELDHAEAAAGSEV